MTPDTYDHWYKSSGRMYQVSYGEASSLAVWHLIHTTTSLIPVVVCIMCHTTWLLAATYAAWYIRPPHYDRFVVGMQTLHLWRAEGCVVGKHNWPAHNTVQGRPCIPSCSRQTPNVHTAIREYIRRCAPYFRIGRTLFIYLSYAKWPP